MAKKKKKVHEQAAKAVRLDSAGWGFWLAAFAVLAAPAWYVSNRSMYASERNGATAWAGAFALAAIGAGAFSVAVNYVLRMRAAAVKRKLAAGRKKK